MDGLEPAPDPRAAARERLLAELAEPGAGRRSLVGVLLAIAAFVLAVSVAAWQVTDEATALPMLRAALASLTDIDTVVAEEGEALRSQAQRQGAGALEVPGYPLPIALEAREVAGASDAQLRTMLLDRSAALVYAEGLRAFDRTGEQAIDRFSMEGLLEAAAGQLSGRVHDRAGYVAALAAVVCGLLGALLAVLGDGWARMRAPAAAVGLGGVGAAGLSLAAWAIAGQVGGGDVFMQDLRTIIQAALGAGVRNGAILAAAGLAVAAASWGLEVAERRTLLRGEVEEEPAALAEEGEQEAG